MSSVEFIDKAQELKNRELNLRKNLENLENTKASIESEIRYERRKIDLLEARLSAINTNSEYDDAATDNSAEKADIQAEIELAYEAIDNYEVNKLDVDEKIDDVKNQISIIEHKEEETLSEIEDSANITKNNMAILASQGGDYATYVAQAYNASYNNLSGFSQAAQILGGNISMGSSGSGGSMVSSSRGISSGTSVGGQNFYQTVTIQRNVGSNVNISKCNSSALGGSKPTKTNIKSSVFYDDGASARRQKGGGLGQKNTTGKQDTPAAIHVDSSPLTAYEMEDFKILEENDFGAVNEKVMDYEKSSYVTDGILSVAWKNDAADIPHNEMLSVGDVVARYGSESGSYFSDIATDFNSVQLPYTEEKQERKYYKVLKPLPVKQSTVAEQAWNEDVRSSTAQQYVSGLNTALLLEQGYIIEISKEDAFRLSPFGVTSIVDHRSKKSNEVIDASSNDKYTKRTYSLEMDIKNRKSGDIIHVKSCRKVHQLNNIDIDLVIPARTKMANGRKTKRTITNCELMKKGKAPFVINNEGKLVQVELHHSTGVETQRGSEYFNNKAMDGTLIELPSDLHDKYSRQIHIKGYKYSSFRVDISTGKKSFDSYKYARVRARYWKDRVNYLLRQKAAAEVAGSN